MRPSGASDLHTLQPLTASGTIVLRGPIAFRRPAASRIHRTSALALDALRRAGLLFRCGLAHSLAHLLPRDEIEGDFTFQEHALTGFFLDKSLHRVAILPCHRVVRAQNVERLAVGLLSSVELDLVELTGERLRLLVEQEFDAPLGSEGRKIFVALALLLGELGSGWGSSRRNAAQGFVALGGNTLALGFGALGALAKGADGFIFSGAARRLIAYFTRSCFIPIRSIIVSFAFKEIVFETFPCVLGPKVGVAGGDIRVDDVVDFAI